MPNDYNIPANKIATTGMVGVNAPQVNLQGFMSQDPNAAAWAGLSESMGGLADAAMNIGELEGDQDMILGQYQNQLNEIAELRGLNDQEIEEVFKREQGNLQKQGIIKAYENFIFIWHNDPIWDGAFSLLLCNEISY